LAAISYDSEATLRGFTEKHGITFPLLSDPGSSTIKAWGLLNTGATGHEAGIPYPGTFVIGPLGVILSRSFEQAYQERDTAASILAALHPANPPAAGSVEVAGKYLTVKVGQSDAIAAPGHRVTLTLDVTPGPRVHVYAPGQDGYIPVDVTLAPSDDYKIATARYPAPATFVFAPLKETVKVYDQPFRIGQDVTLTLTRSMRQRGTARETLTIAGSLRYQACDDKVCFPPDTIPIEWKITLGPIER
jgi:DsbC/DsbD-like thiol-disulfide interchange protein